MIKAAIYARKSTLDERDEQDGKSTARQVSQAREFIASKGWVVADEMIFVDENISGTIFDLSKRVGLGRMLESLKQFDVIVTMEQSRLGRDIAKTLDLITRLEAAGIEVWSYSEGRRISVEEELDEMNASMRAIVDKAESRRASTRTAAGLAAKALKGHATGAAPFGYALKRIGDEKSGHSEYVINEAQAVIVRRIFALAAQGHGARRICNILNAEGVKAPGVLRRNAKREMTRSELWSKHTVKPIIRRRLYIGELVFGVTQSKGKRAGVRKGAKPTVTSLPDLRIVDQETWDKVQAQHERNQASYLRLANGRLLSKPEATIVSKRLMNSIGRCYVCGGPLVYVTKSQKHKARYYCSNRTHRGALACTNKAGVLADALDHAVQVRLEKMLDEDFDKVIDLCLEQAAVWKEQRASHVTDRDMQKRRVAELENIIARLTDAVEQGQPVGTRLKERQQELDQLRWKMEELDAVPDRSTIEGLIESIRLGLPKPEPQVPTAPFGPLVGLGVSDPATIRATLRKIGVAHVTVAPDGQGGWTFKGAGDFSGLILGNGHRRSKAAPPAPRARKRPGEAVALLDFPTRPRGPRRAPQMIRSTKTAST